MLLSGDLAVRRRVTAISFIAPNSAPPAGTETPVTGQVVLMQAGFRGMHVRTKVMQLCTGLFLKSLKLLGVAEGLKIKRSVPQLQGDAVTSRISPLIMIQNYSQGLK